MKRPMVLAHKFVKAIPNELEERTLYAVHGLRHGDAQMLLRMR